MKNLLAIGGLFAASLCSTAELDSAQQFTVTGELMLDGIMLLDYADERPTPVPDDMDWSKARVVVAHEIVSPEGVIESIELASGYFKDGSLTLEGEIDEQIDAQILLYAGEGKPSTLKVLISPSSTTSFAVNKKYAHLELLEVSSKVRDVSQAFTITADLSFGEGELDGAVARVRASEYDASGATRGLIFGKVMLDNGKFVIEAEVDEPRVVNISIASLTEFGQTHAVVEPGATITLASHDSSLRNIFATSSKGKHSTLIDAWQQSKEYLSTHHDYQVAYQDYLDAEKAREEHVATEESDDGSDERSIDSSAVETPRYRDLLLKLNRLRYDFLEDVAANAEDPMDVLLALELGAYWGDEEALPIYDRLANSLDRDLVLRRVIQDRNAHALNLARAGTDMSLTIGKQAPHFALPNLSGDKVALNDILSENDFVLVDFWASWCGGCIATFPALRDLYASYHNRGFEIVSISIDEEPVKWKEGSETYNPTWINLGELEDFEGEVVTSYGVNGIPKTYLLNSEGKIVQKDLSTDQLRDFLVEEYGEAIEEVEF